MSDDKCAAWHIFHTPFECKIKQMFCHSKTEIRMMGIPSSGDKMWDKMAAESYRTVYFTIAQMVYYFTQGANIILVNPKDSVDVFKFLMRHLYDWRRVVNEVVNFPNPPIEDLRNMSIFASAVAMTISRNGYELEDHSPVGQLQSRLQAFVSGGVLSNALQRYRPVAAGEIQEIATVKMDPVFDEIIQRLMKVRRSALMGS